MNPYGARARNHWQKWLPQRFGQIRDPETFFTMLGEEAEARVEELSQDLAGSDPPGESFEEKLGRLNMAHLNAESEVLKEMVLLEPEPEAEDQ